MADPDYRMERKKQDKGTEKQSKTISNDSFRTPTSGKQIPKGGENE
ncbi:hypothetical protein [Salibacterium halotolerans]|uniref:Uncharacterized protein n=1 Tax=Salibacterium halotolerans TaxID=1884432 RepID=A0A1I5NAS9_9BACI|nr:hypothetical protein [Salibacterium halotolerans]SFP18456.1 hypothetical protein SAMN05518683_10349 [Salibacterium halotolerans]